MLKWEPPSPGSLGVLLRVMVEEKGPWFGDEMVNFYNSREIKMLFETNIELLKLTGDQCLRGRSNYL